MEIISHRAINGKDRENSPKAIKWAFQNNYGIETDLRVNGEGSLVISHDEDGLRLFNNPKKIIEMSDEECKNLDICFFEDVCKAYKEIGSKSTLCLHIKDINEPLVVEKTISLIKKYNLQNHSFLVAVDNQTLSLINLVKDKHSDINVGLHLPENSPLFKEEIFKKAEVIWVDEESGGWINEKMIDLAKKTNSKVFCMSPEFVPNNIFQENYKDRWNDLIQMNLNAIVTDHADELREFLNNT